MQTRPTTAPAMHDGQTTGVLEFIRHLADTGGHPEAPDRELLGRFTAERNERAFAAIVRRHGPLVLRLCRRIVPNEADAEDAFQATFLVLSRKAASVQPPEALAGWLYGVAYRAAHKARIAYARRQKHEACARSRPAADPLAETASAEAGAIIDRELARLPDKFRLPLVLCYLEALSGNEAAQRLGWPMHTLKTRLEQAREKLRRRLRARGVAVPAGLAALLCHEAAAQGAIPAALLESTVKTATAIVTSGAAGGPAAATIAAAEVAALAQGVITTMALTRLKTIVASLVIFLAVVTAGALAFQGGPAPDKSHGGQRGAAKAKTAAPPPAQAEVAAEPKPRIVKPGGFVFRMAWGGKEDMLATVTLGQTKADKGAKKVTEFNSTVMFWDADKADLRLSLGKENKVRIESITVAPDGKLAAITALTGVTGRGDAYEIRLVEPATGTFKKTIKQPDTARAVAFSPNGKLVAVGGAVLPTNLAGPFHRMVRLWDVNEVKVVKEFKQELQLKEDDPYLDGLRYLAFSPNGKLLATADADSKVRLTDVETGKVVRTLEGHAGVAFTLAFAPDGKTLASGGFDETARVWDVTTGKHLRTLPGTKGAIRAVAFSPDGKLLATAADEVTLWDAATWQAKKTLPGGDGPATGVAFSPDHGKTLAVATAEHVKLWRVDEILASERP